MSTGDEFSAIAEELIVASRRSTRRGVKTLTNALPHIVVQIRQDARPRGPLSFWGKSQNVDENTETIIVDPAVLKVIGSVAGRKISATTPHAGLQHTYGYLFSTIETPYGFKRDRWIETEIESAFQLHLTTLGPRPHEGSLLTNATWLAGQIAFRENASRLQRLHKFLSGKIAEDLASANLYQHEHRRLCETVSAMWRSRLRKWALQTDLVTISGPAELTLLVYSTLDHNSNAQQLITLFPISADIATEIWERGEHRRRKDIELHYNACVPGLSGRLSSGTCTRHEFKTELPRGTQVR